MTTSTVQQPVDRSKDGVALRLAGAHFRVDMRIRRIFRLRSSADEESQSEPIKLLEVNDDTTMSGIVPVFFGPHTASGVFFPSVIVEIRPEEFQLVVNGELPLPHGWKLAEEYPRPADPS